jgi:hypothetical protein
LTPRETKSPIDDEKSAYYQVLVKVFNGIPPKVLPDNGRFEGEVCFTLHPNGDVQAHQWALSTWVNIGQFSCSRHRIEGQLEKDVLRGQKIGGGLAPNTLEYFRAVAEQRQTDSALAHPTFQYALVLPGHAQRPQLRVDTALVPPFSSYSSTADTIIDMPTGSVTLSQPQMYAQLSPSDNPIGIKDPIETCVAVKALGPEIDKSNRNKADAERVWDSSLFTRFRQEDALKYLAKVRGTPIQPIEHALYPVLENLKNYADEKAGFKPRDYFTRHYTVPPVWCIDRTAAGEKSFFGEDYGAPPARVGRDMRYNPPTPIGFEHHMLRSGNIRQQQGVSGSYNPFVGTGF